MSLPTISIPNIPLPFDIPVLVHPAVVHFVIAIPVVIILLEIVNLFFKKRALSVFSLFLISLVALFMVSAYFTGSVDGKEAYSLLASEGQAELKEHKLLGAYLVYGSLAMVILKLLFMAFSKVVARLFFILILLGFTAGILKQGKEGGELVYKYGANNEAIANVSSDKDDLKDELEELQEKYDELKESASAKTEEPKEETTKEEVVTETSSTEESSASEDATPTEKVATTEEPTKSATETIETKVEEKVSEVESAVVEKTAETVSTSTVSLEIPEDANDSH